MFQKVNDIVAKASKTKPDLKAKLKASLAQAKTEAKAQTATATAVAITKYDFGSGFMEVGFRAMDRI